MEYNSAEIEFIRSIEYLQRAYGDPDHFVKMSKKDTEVLNDYFRHDL